LIYNVPALSFFWGDPSEFLPAADAAGIAALHPVGSVDDTLRAKQAGLTSASFVFPCPRRAIDSSNEAKNGPNTLFSEEGVPLMPLNSGDNSVTSKLIYKLLTLKHLRRLSISSCTSGRSVSSPSARLPANLPVT
jgi:hypothetical protein